MAVFFGQPIMEVFSSASTVTLSGQVQDPAGNPIARMVVAFGSANLTQPLGVTVSDRDTGDFSFDLPGTEVTEFACVVQGELGENSVIHSHKTVV